MLSSSVLNQGTKGSPTSTVELRKVKEIAIDVLDIVTMTIDRIPEEQRYHVMN